MVDQDTSTIHVMGGWDGNNNLLSSTEKLIFNDFSRQWEMASDLSEVLSGSAAVSSKSKKFVGYLVGGKSGDNRGISRIWGLQRSDMRWIELSKSLKTPRHFHTVVNVNVNDFPCD